ncbi:splicing factor U2AF 35 kDa subunit [Kwoniella heveanensis CBS 569]|uniref:Splicing factor U2AF 35 kDa subunit n=1 Tax=Kwoniella heveanensis BCC8398 TaxID=1296120 RepID=A0A1B9GTA1_9TREE|nr:splicing factor U2AF 35 kDa subunit [Kwoniella heveanensis BCC8398]OCF44395.1 splicing factor U2AF 35 kDa subunit [Kwoniella heveanensis CBS 569]
MASHLANIFGTEQDRVNCSFYLKIGACRHGDRCSRKHIKPQFSQTILLPNVYNNPGHTPEGQHLTREELQANFDRFYEDFYIEMAKYGHLLEMHVCDNVGDHLSGNVYARYEWEAEAARAVQGLNDRWFAMRPLHCELSPVTDFRESCCRQNELGECKREGFCNFMHLCHPTKNLVRSLDASQRLSRRLKQQANGGGPGGPGGLNDGGEDLGWVPGGGGGGGSGAAGGGDDGPGGWMPPSERDRNGHGGGGADPELGWVPSRRDDDRRFGGGYGDRY